jgi:hypothetical protein
VSHGDAPDFHGAALGTARRGLVLFGAALFLRAVVMVAAAMAAMLLLLRRGGVRRGGHRADWNKVDIFPRLEAEDYCGGDDGIRFGKFPLHRAALAAPALFAGCRAASRQGADCGGHIGVFLESVLYTAKSDLCLAISRNTCCDMFVFAPEPIFARACNTGFQSLSVYIWNTPPEKNVIRKK